MSIKSKVLNIEGMSCVNCENAIQRKLKKTAGIKMAKVSYNKGTAYFSYDTDIISLKDIIAVIEKLDYKVIQEGSNGDHSVNKLNTILGTLVIILALYTVMRHLGMTGIFNAFPQAEEGMGYGMLFIIGLLTSVHCIAMCGGINLSQCIITDKKETDTGRLGALKPSILYNGGRLFSYTVIGAIVGGLGSIISFSGRAKGIVQIAAGIFMIIMGLNMLNIFPWLRRLNLRMPRIFAQKINSEKSSNSPLYVGLLNGLMPCGPLQAMQLYALSTGNIAKGALSMFLFCLGTIPLMFGLGALSSVISNKFTKKVMYVGAILVVVLGISMFNSGTVLSGISIFPAMSSASGGENQSVVQDDLQVVQTYLSPGSYDSITVQEGIPVRWIITAEKGTINGCNNRIFIPEYDIEKSFEIGDNIIEFIPEKAGTYTYTCWMGMIRSTIVVLDKQGNAVEPENGGNQRNGRPNLNSFQ